MIRVTLAFILFLGASECLAQSTFSVSLEQWDPDAVDIIRLTADFDGDNRADYALGTACSGRAATQCPYALFLARSSYYVEAGSFYAYGDLVEVCADSSGRVHTLAPLYPGQGEIVLQNYVVDGDSLRLLQEWFWHMDGQEPAGLPRLCGTAVKVEYARDDEYRTLGDAAWSTIPVWQRR